LKNTFNVTAVFDFHPIQNNMPWALCY